MWRVSEKQSGAKYNRTFNPHPNLPPARGKEPDRLIALTLAWSTRSYSIETAERGTEIRCSSVSTSGVTVLKLLPPARGKEQDWLGALFLQCCLTAGVIERLCRGEHHEVPSLGGGRLGWGLRLERVHLTIIVDSAISKLSTKRKSRNQRLVGITLAMSRLNWPNVSLCPAAIASKSSGATSFRMSAIRCA